MQEGVSRGQFKIFNASQWRLAIVVAQFNRDITDALLMQALATAKKYKLSPSRVDVFKVPGSVEIPVVLQALAKTKKYDGLVALGCVIRGETPHFDYVCKIATEGIREVMEDGMPVGFGILTCENKKQAKARLSAGAAAMEAALQTAKVLKTILK